MSAGRRVCGRVQNRAAPSTFARLQARAVSASWRIAASGMSAARARHASTSRATVRRPQSNSRAVAAASARSWENDSGAGSTALLKGLEWSSICGAYGTGRHAHHEVTGQRDARSRNRADERKARYGDDRFDVERDWQTRHAAEGVADQQLAVETEQRADRAAGDEQHGALAEQPAPKHPALETLALDERDQATTLPNHRAQR